VLQERGRRRGFATNNLGGKQIIGPQQFFGEMSLLIGDRRSATATAVTFVECVVLPKEALFSVLIAEPQIILNIAQLMGQRQVTFTACLFFITACLSLFASGWVRAMSMCVCLRMAMAVCKT
jgi:CRP-like cAMP-binding protein